MKVFRAVFLSYLVLSSQISWAWGSTCPEDTDLSSLTDDTKPQEYQRLLNQLKLDFEAWHERAQSSISQSLDCLADASIHPYCSQRLSYFFETLPHQLELYREYLALSRWDSGYFQRVIRNNIDIEAPFNWQLKINGSFYRGHVQPQPMNKNDEEFQKVKADFDRKMEVAIQETLEKLTPEAYPFDSPDDVERQRQLLENRDLKAILTNPVKNHLAKQALKTFSRRTFELNSKRITKILVDHPILAMISSTEISHQSLTEALERMQTNLDKEYVDIQKQIIQVQARIDNPEKTIMSRHFYSLMDYVGISEGLASSDPSLCPIIRLVDKHHNRGRNILMAIGGAAIVGMMAASFFVTIPVIVVAGAAGAGATFQGYLLYQSNKEVTEVSNRAFVSPEQALNLADSKDIYSASQDLNHEIYVYTPMAALGIPLLKAGNILKFAKLNGAAK